MVSVRLAGELWPLVAPRRRRALIVVPDDPTASLGHVVQSLGVPLTEVGRLRVDGVPAGPDQRPPAGAIVEVGAVERPQSVPGWEFRFLLDVHLGTLARRLRLLGIDTAYRNDADDDALIARAGDERRLLLTQDRGLLRRRVLWRGAYVRGAGAAAQLADVLDRFDPPRKPWTRCPGCNGGLEPVAKHEIADRLQPGTRRCYDEFARCRRCGRIYWRGAHAGRLEAIIAAAGAGAGAGRVRPARRIRGGRR